MKIAIMQPYFFPYLGYFQLINYVDQFILFDDVQYIRHGWINRNRILKPAQGWQYIVCPIESHKRDTLIKDIKLLDCYDWKDKILRQLDHYKKRAPYYDSTIKLLKDCFLNNETNVTKFNAYCLKMVCEYLGLDAEIAISSELDFDYEAIKQAGDWALEMSRQTNAKEYVNPVAGAELFDKGKFDSSGIRLSFVASELQSYNQRRADFEAGLSIIDLMMFNSESDLKKMLNSYVIL